MPGTHPGWDTSVSQGTMHTQTYTHKTKKWPCQLTYMHDFGRWKETGESSETYMDMRSTCTAQKLNDLRSCTGDPAAVQANAGQFYITGAGHQDIL